MLASAARSSQQPLQSPSVLSLLPSCLSLLQYRELSRINQEISRQSAAVGTDLHMMDQIAGGIRKEEEIPGLRDLLESKTPSIDIVALRAETTNEKNALPGCFPEPASKQNRVHAKLRPEGP